ncbi:MAG TPA: RNase adapter RapZ [Bacteroidales bacterium]|nr:RNase adapter RapZ [Bacteroidales bacterium]HSA43359.1 RNase adapter RapZ [Bacteroidales bacterium]
MDNISGMIGSMFRNWSGTPALTVTPLAASGSPRKYFRIQSSAISVIGAYHADQRENQAFFYLTEHFRRTGLAVPELLAREEEKGCYLLEDLGDTSLFSLLSQEETSQEPDHLVTELYKQAVATLPVFQVKGHRELDYSQCYPRAAFDIQSMLWDLNYFKYYYLKLSGIPFDEQLLENDFQDFAAMLLTRPSDFFMYRDFQSRNMMVRQNKLYFIDYQGGRKGNPAYDLCSLLYDAKANLSVAFRQTLLDHYLPLLEKMSGITPDAFTGDFYLFVYIRLMQALGAYGYRGIHQKKEHFLLSIPYALRNLSWLLNAHPLPDRLLHLRQVLESLPGTSLYKLPDGSPLTITIRSFSYKNGIPPDTSEHGGGFVFDCRALPNPGRQDEFRHLTGLDRGVIDFLAAEQEVDDFLFGVFHVVDQSVRNYLKRGFTGLTVNFGCTGGQHRSVYCCERLGEHLKRLFQVNVKLEHREIGMSSRR